jgi:hypothetical protein
MCDDESWMLDTKVPKKTNTTDCISIELETRLVTPTHSCSYRPTVHSYSQNQFSRVANFAIIKAESSLGS